MFVKNLLPALPNAENTALLMEAKNGNTEARDKFFEHNMRLMVYFANKFKSSGYEMEDLFSASQLGFLKAFNTFDISKGIQFATYGRRCMENEILMFMQKNKRHRKNHDYLEFYVATSEEGEGLTLSEIIPHPGPSSLALEESDALRQALKVFKQKTSERNRHILTLKFEKEWNQPRIAEKLGISQSAVSRIILKMLDQIRKIEMRQAR